MPRTKWWPARKSPPPPLRFAPDKREEAANGLPETLTLVKATLTWISRQFLEVIHEPKIVETDMVVDLNIKSATLSVTHPLRKA